MQGEKNCMFQRMCFSRLLLKEAEFYVMVIFFILWIMVCGGAVYQYYFHEKYKHFETFLYLFMGITPGVLCVPGMVDSSGIQHVIEGGGIYVLGVVFFKMDGFLPFAHAIWHLFVVLGAWWHFLAVANYLYLNTPESSGEIGEKMVVSNVTIM